MSNYCEICNGLGKCKSCYGEGRILISKDPLNPVWQTCRSCNGTVKCWACNGTGKK